MGGLYSGVLKPVFFRHDPEVVHDAMTQVGVKLGKVGVGRSLTSGFFQYQNPMLRQKILGIEFKNPIGLSAGFDKNAELTDILPSVGFGFAELGSITGEPCGGNEKPRLWRLPRSKSLVVNYGLKNDGCEAIAKRLKEKKFEIPFGMSVAMTNCEANLDTKNAVFDYAKAFKTLEPLAAYMTINISCPNTKGGQPFVAPHKLDYLLDIVDEIPTEKPIFIKFSPDLSHQDIDELLAAARSHRVHGIICTNLTKKRDAAVIREGTVPAVGGLSGKMVQEQSEDMLAYIYRKECQRKDGKQLVLIGSGGVFTAEDAYRKIRLGASLIHIITGMIFEGPQVISEINQGLVKLLKRDGFTTVSQAIGIDNK